MKSVVFLLSLVVVFEASAQIRPDLKRRLRRDSIIGQRVLPRTVQQPEVRRVFNQIERSILNSSLSSVPVSFARQVYVNITGGESGYFSQNQVVSVLQSYFVPRTPLSFEFSRHNDQGPTPYATGRLTFVARGRRESAQVYVSLAIQDSQWVISQFNIY
jgi:hypothetical protein